MKSKKLVFAFLLALMLCLLLAPSAFATDDEVTAPSTIVEGDSDPEKGVVAKNVTVEDEGGDKKDVVLENDSLQKLIDDTNPKTDDGLGTDVKVEDGEKSDTVEKNDDIKSNDAGLPSEENNGSKVTEIVLNNNISESITISAGQTVYLNLNGHELSNTSGVKSSTITIQEGGYLNIYGGGKVSNTSDASSVIDNKGTLIFSDTTVVNNSQKNQTSILNEGSTAYAEIKSGTFETLGCDDSGKAKVYGATNIIKEVVAYNGAEITIEGGNYKALQVAGNLTGDSRITHAYINGGNIALIVIAQYSDMTIMAGEIGTILVSPDSATTINGGTINSVNTGLMDDDNQDLGTFLNYNGGIYGFDPTVETDYITTKTGTVSLVANGYYAIGAASASELVKKLSEEGEVEITSAASGLELTDIPDGVNIVNSSDVAITVNGTVVAAGASYFKAVAADVVETVEADVVETVVPAAVETVTKAANELVATVAEESTNYSIASNKEFTIQLSYTDNSETNQLPEIISVAINGVEVEFSVAADGTIVLSPEVLAALGPGTHVITIMTSDGPVTLTIVITE